MHPLRPNLPAPKLPANTAPPPAPPHQGKFLALRVTRAQTLALQVSPGGAVVPGGSQLPDSLDSLLPATMVES